MHKHPRIAVIGSSGQLANALVDAAAARQITAITGGRPIVDLRKPDSLSAFIEAAKPDLVVNTGGMTAVDAAENDKALAFALNATGARNLARACVHAGVPLIHISTDYVFNGSGSTPWTEVDPIAPLNVYGASKAEGENEVRTHQPRHAILRTSWIHGEHGNNFLKTMLRLAETRREVAVVADQFGSPTYAGHLADAILDLAERLLHCAPDQTPWGTYHVSGTGATSWHGLAAEIFRHVPLLGIAPPSLRAITTAQYPLPARRPAYSVLNTSCLARTFGIALPPWQDGVARGIWRIAAQRAGKPIETQTPAASVAAAGALK